MSSWQYIDIVLEEQPDEKKVGSLRFGFFGVLIFEATVLITRVKGKHVAIINSRKKIKYSDEARYMLPSIQSALDREER